MLPEANMKVRQHQEDFSHLSVQITYHGLSDVFRLRGRLHPDLRPYFLHKIALFNSPFLCDTVKIKQQFNDVC